VLDSVGEALDPGGEFWSGIPIAELPAHTTLAIGELRISFAPIRHYVPGWAMRFEQNGHTLVYTADTGPSDEVSALADGAHVLLSECTLPSRPSYLQEWGHLAPAEAGEMARAARVGRLLLTHRWAENEPDQLVRDARTAFGGSVALAKEMESYAVE
jgi:ribonuclease BN (tRNA processing enzyme)